MTKIRSMTGFGQGSSEAAGLHISSEIRSVNNRFADVRLRLPGELQPLEAALRRRVLARVRRGRVELTVSLQRSDGSDRRPVLNRALLDEVLAAAEELGGRGLSGGPDVATVLGIAGMFRADAVELVLGDAESDAVARSVDRALDAHDADRCREGASLTADLLERFGRMGALASDLRRRAAETPSRLRDRLIERLEALGGEVELDATRVAQEAAFLADRADLTEEIVRLEGHLAQARVLLDPGDGQPVGKRLDFLVQEMHREINTVASKSTDLELTRVALDLKAETEKNREQVQNLE